MESRIKIFVAVLAFTCLTASVAQAKVSVIGGLSHEKKAAHG